MTRDEGRIPSRREDADVAWRAQLLGWTCIYCPVAVAYHVRTVLPTNRKTLSALVNMHSVKNRWLLRIKNLTGRVYGRFWLPITMRDMIVVGACLTREFSSLPGFLFVAKKWRSTWAKRRKSCAASALTMLIWQAGFRPSLSAFPRRKLPKRSMRPVKST